MVLYKGDDWSIKFQYTLDSDPFDITTLTEITACFKATDGTKVEVKKSDAEIVLTNAVAGKGEIKFTKVKSALVKKSENLTLVVVRTDAGGLEKTNEVEGYEIKERDC